MAYAKEMMGGGLSAGQAQAIGGQANSVAATGSAQTDAAALNASLNIVTGADTTKGVILTGNTVGDEVWVFNNSASTLKVYPPTGAAISVQATGLGTANAAFVQIAQSCMLFKCQSKTQWFAITSA